MNEFLIETEQLEASIGEENLRIVDCHYHLEIKSIGNVILTSGKADWELSHIPDSVFIDLMTELSDCHTPLPFMMPPLEQFARIMSRNGIDDRTHLVIYDRSESTWAARLWWMLRVCGFDNARILNGGWHKWQAEGRPVSSAPATTLPKAEFVPRPRPQLFVDKKTVLESLDERGATRICALGEIIYQKGHIPGSVNIPSASLIDPERKTFLPPERLEQIFQRTGVFKQERIICYCGGSISACCDAFALTMLGYPNVTVYDGSMEEWGRDPGLPLEITDPG
jgi:thiosulfate/3-mercaptopyruvate sulfurtransferase